MHPLPYVNTSLFRSFAKFPERNKATHKQSWQEKYVKDEKRCYNDLGQIPDWPGDGLNLPTS